MWGPVLCVWDGWLATDAQGLVNDRAGGPRGFEMAGESDLIGQRTATCSAREASAAPARRTPCRQLSESLPRPAARSTSSSPRSPRRTPPSSDQARLHYQRPARLLPLPRLAGLLSCLSAATDRPARCLRQHLSPLIIVSVVFVPAMFMTIMDVTIVNVALPTLAQQSQPGPTTSTASSSAWWSAWR